MLAGVYCIIESKDLLSEAEFSGQLRSTECYLSLSNFFVFLQRSRPGGQGRNGLISRGSTGYANREN